ncbi:hypothetical protein DH2020_029095 [Rehmannia glutinosa]|uniref:Nucleotide-diphospho-sugar transferase domain-containing protein n=1 Tax=Rehmannia glutinosa TaxID=99300 RepID=A0ABR0VTU0_REHGL
MDSGGGGGISNPKSDEKFLESGGYHHDSSNNNHHDHHRRHYFSSVAVNITLLFLVLGITCLALNKSPYDPTRLFQSSYNSFSGPKADSITTPNLSSPSSDNINHGPMQENVTSQNLPSPSFRIGIGTQHLLKHVLVVSLDQKAYSRCLQENLHCYALTTEEVDFSGEAYFMTEDYLKMMWRRIDFLRIVLDMGYDFVFTDNNISQENTTRDVLNMIKPDPFIQRIELKIRFLDTAYFGGFCEPKDDMDLAITMHANCCIGLENKIHDIKIVIDDWKKIYVVARWC